MTKPSNLEMLHSRGLKMYVAYYIKKASAYTTPVKTFFPAKNDIEAIGKLYEQCNAKGVDDFKSIVLMEMTTHDTFRDVLIKEATDRKSVTREQVTKGAALASNVVSLTHYRNERNDVGKKKNKPHVKLSWLSRKITDSGESRILDQMKYVTEEGFVPKELPPPPYAYAPKTMARTTSTTQGNTGGTGIAGAVMGAVSQEDDEAMREYYGYGPYNWGNWD